MIYLITICTLDIVSTCISTSLSRFSVSSSLDVGLTPTCIGSGVCGGPLGNNNMNIRYGLAFWRLGVVALEALLVAVILPLLPNITCYRAISSATTSAAPTAVGDDSFDFPRTLDISSSDLLGACGTHRCLSHSTSYGLPSAGVECAPRICRSHLHHLPAIMRLPCGDVIRRCVSHCYNHLERSIDVFLNTTGFCVPVFRRTLRDCKLPLRLGCLPIVRSTLGPETISGTKTANL